MGIGLSREYTYVTFAGSSVFQEEDGILNPYFHRVENVGILQRST